MLTNVHIKKKKKKRGKKGRISAHKLAQEQVTNNMEWIQANQSPPEMYKAHPEAYRSVEIFYFLLRSGRQELLPPFSLRRQRWDAGCWKNCIFSKIQKETTSWGSKFNPFIAWQNKSRYSGFISLFMMIFSSFTWWWFFLNEIFWGLISKTLSSYYSSKCLRNHDVSFKRYYMSSYL